jgi:UDP-N-acetylglucosamine 4,6-dehydratase
MAFNLDGELPMKDTTIQKHTESPLSGKTILVTGGTGSFGRRFIEMALKSHRPRRIIVFSRDELKQLEFRNECSDSRLSFFIGDVRDLDRLRRAFEANVDIVVHAAALKQVPACEYNPFEAIKTNILGAKNVIDAAIDSKVFKVIALSTDKAVNPVNLYGATKLCAEKLFVQGNSYAGSRQTRFSCIRYGNVLSSRGSVVPIFKKQREQGKLTITDRRMTRFWLTLEQAVQFVIRCIGTMEGGEVFVPRIPSMRLVDMAKAIAPECDVEFSSIRPGEKLHEVLISRDEARHTAQLDDLFIIKPEYPWWGANNWKQAQSLPEDFSFTSERNDHCLSAEELLYLIGGNTDTRKASAIGG